MQLLLIFPVVLSGQVPESANVQRAEMKKLEWMVGNWKGTGWAEMGPQGRKEFTQTETIQSKVDGLVLVVEGRGESKDNGSTLHNTWAFVSYDERIQTFHWRSFTGEGRLTDAKTTVNAEMVQWEFQMPQLGRFRYTRTRTEKGECFVMGEREEDNHTWHKLIEYTLRRQQ